MNNKILNLLIIACLMLSLGGCYKDLGNYDYHEINELNIDIPKVSVRLPKAGEVAEVTITPKITQTLLKNENHLEYLWEKGPLDIQFTKEYEAIGTERTCKFDITSKDDKNFTVRLTVSDTETGLKWYKTGVVSVVKPFSSTWFVLQEKDGDGVLGAADGDLEASVIIPDVYMDEIGQRLPLEGNPFRLMAYHKYGLNHFFVKVPMKPILAIATDKDMWMMDAAKLSKVWEAKEMLLYPVRKTPDVARYITAYKINKAGEMIIDNGNLYWAYLDGYSVHYRVGVDEENQDIEPTHFTEYSSGTKYLVYDNKYHRFMSFSIGEMMDIMNISRNNKYVRNPTSTGYATIHKKLRTFGNNNYAFNPDDISEIAPNIEVLQMIRTENYAMALASTPGSSEVKILEFGNTEDVTGLYSFNAPDGLKAKDLQFCSSYGFNQIFFAAAKNKLYKVEIKGTNVNVSKIYEYEDPNATIAGIKFKEEELLDGEAAPNNYLLGVAVNNGENGSIVELQITLAGDLKRDEKAVYEYKGFSKIIDFAYSFQD